MIVRSWCYYMLMCLISASVQAARLEALTLSQEGSKSSLVIRVNGAFTHKIFALNNPYRVVLDLNNTQLSPAVRSTYLSTPLIKKVRTGQLNKQTLRIVLDVSQKVKTMSAPWPPKGAFQGLKVDFLPEKTTGVVAKSGVTPTVQTKPSLPLNSNPKPIKVAHSPSKSLRDVVVVLDAGHGGKDPGARGPRASREKDVVLAITLKLKQLIDKEPGMRAVLTRSGDYYVGLRRRLDIARKYNGDVFVSIHADAFNNPHSNGASVFALSQSGATSEAARWIAEKENYSELGGVNLGDLDDQNGVVRSVLIDLSQTATINSGLQMGSGVLRQLDRFTRLHNNKVEQARFMVLKSPDIPSILVETGFISNPVEERNLTSSAYQNRLSQAIFQGVKGYFWESPPHGTRIEALASSRFHWVKAGETLPIIASRYKVSVASLQEINRMSAPGALKPGQKIVVPRSWA